MITVAIIGSRPPKVDAPQVAQNKYLRLVKRLDYFFKSIPEDRGDDDIRFISGNGPGIDQAAYAKAMYHQIDFDVRPARWKRYGRPAGMMRNPKIILPADVVVAFWDGDSPGTGGSLNIAAIEGKPTLVVYPDSPAPTWEQVLRLLQPSPSN